VEDGRLDVYDGGLDSGVIWDNALGQYALLRDTEKELARGDAPYYHEPISWVTESGFAGIGISLRNQSVILILAPATPLIRSTCLTIP